MPDENREVMNARRFFNPARRQDVSNGGEGQPDRNDGQVYVYFDEDIVLAVNIALATKRPLLLSGPSGCGKSTLARNIALTLGRRYYEHVVTARTEARDLLYRFDAVHRLNDAQVGSESMPPIEKYIVPGALWWALSPETAAERGSKAGLAKAYRAADPSRGTSSSDAVVLIDEIDKADPDVPNGLLVPLGSFRFTVAESNAEVASDREPLIVITNNGERELPEAFTRRCVALTVPSPTEEQLIEIARAVLPQAERYEGILGPLARRLIALAAESAYAQRYSTAEYLDAVRACSLLGITDEANPHFAMLLQITLRKPQVWAGD
jgi:MoxR-like ATPase